MEVDRHRLARLADVLGLRADRQLALLERRAAAAGCAAPSAPCAGRRRAARRGRRRSRARTSAAEAGGSSGTGRRCGGPTATRRPCPNRIWFSPIADLDAVGIERRRDPGQLDRAPGPARSPALSPPAPGSAAFFTAQPVAVGGGHRHRALAELDQDAGQHRPRLVPRRRPRHVVDRSATNASRSTANGGPDGLGQVREVLGALGVQRVLALARTGSAPRPSPAVCSIVTSDCGQRPHDLEQQPARAARSSRAPAPAPAPARAARAPCRWRRARRGRPPRRAAGSPRGSGRWIVARRRGLRSAGGRAALPGDRRSSCGGTDLPLYWFFKN